MFKKTQHIIKEIFLEKSNKDSTISFHPKNLTHHYQQELQQCHLDTIVVATEYNDIAQLLESYKYQSDRRHAGVFVDLLAKLYTQYPPPSGNIGVVPVPMHWSRYIHRGFDHIHMIAHDLAEKTGHPYLPILGARYSGRQSQLSKKKRFKNREHVYFVKNSKSTSSIVILIDDVISTGSTLNACAGVLRANGAQEVHAYILASNQ